MNSSSTNKTVHLSNVYTYLSASELWLVYQSLGPFRAWTEFWLVQTGTLATPISCVNWTLIGAYRNIGHTHHLRTLNSDWCIQEHWPHPLPAYTELSLVHTGTLATPISCINWPLIGAYRNLGHTHLMHKLNSHWCIREPWPHPSPA